MLNMAAAWFSWNLITSQHQSSKVIMLTLSVCTPFCTRLLNYCCRCCCDRHMRTLMLWSIELNLEWLGLLYVSVVLYTGPRGPPGDTGAAGRTGWRGLPGRPGYVGATGGTGATGAPGVPGLIGVGRGPPGPPGPIGYVGYHGPTGDTGATGKWLIYPMPCRSQWARDLVSIIQLCVVPPSSSSCTWCLLSTFLRRNLSSMCS